MLTFCNGTGTICHNRNLLINLCETFIWILITEKMAFKFIPNKSLWTVSAKKEKTCEKKEKTACFFVSNMIKYFCCDFRDGPLLLRVL